jgi:hypothetical protein
MSPCSFAAPESRSSLSGLLRYPPVPAFWTYKGAGCYLASWTPIHNVRDLASARRAVQFGTTTVRVMGGPHLVDVGMRELHHAGLTDIPEVVAAGMITESPMRPSTPKASTASLPPLLLRLLPGGTNKFPGGISLPLRTSAFSRRTPVSAFERSRWRGGRFACYGSHVMLQGRAFNCDFRFPLIFISHAKSIGCKRKRIQFP